jgi:hypothetical protein
MGARHPKQQRSAMNEPSHLPITAVAIAGCTAAVLASVSDELRGPIELDANREPIP